MCSRTPGQVLLQSATVVSSSPAFRISTIPTTPTHFRKQGPFPSFLQTIRTIFYVYSTISTRWEALLAAAISQQGNGNGTASRPPLASSACGGRLSSPHVLFNETGKYPDSVHLTRIRKKSHPSRNHEHSSIECCRPREESESPTPPHPHP